MTMIFYIRIKCVEVVMAEYSIAELISTTLNSSRMEAGRMDIYEQPYNVVTLADELCLMTEYMTAERNLSCKYVINSEMPSVLMGDGEKIKQIIVNILSNAVRYTIKGYVELDFDYETIGEKDINLIIAIIDTGTGISAERQETIIETLRSFDLKDGVRVRGKGMGLAICKDLVELMDGYIDMESETGAGSTFTVIIPQGIVDKTPIGREENNVFEKERLNVRKLATGGKRFLCPNTKILVVDDNKINLKVALGLLDRYKPQVDVAESGMEAVDMVKNKVYDIIFMDHMMPEMDGIEAAQFIRSNCGENGKKPVMIALTANAIKGAEDMFLQYGFDGFLSKPIDKNELYSLLKKHIKPEDMVEISDEDDKVLEKSENIDAYRVKGIDIEKALEIHSTNIKNVLDLMVLFYEDGIDKVDYIRKYADEGDYKNYEIAVHGLKSAAANIGATALSDEAKEHEYAAKDGSVQFVDENYETLALHYREVLNELMKMLTKNGLLANAEKEESNLPELPGNTSIRERLVNILDALEDFKSKEAMAGVNELLTYKIGADIRTAVNNIKNKLKLYDDDAAEELLRDLIETL